LQEKLSFERLPVAPDPSELADRACKAAAKAATAIEVRGPPLHAARQREGRRIKVMSAVVRRALSRLVAGFPSLLNLPPFYRDLVEVLVGVDKLRKSLGAVDGTAQVVGKLEREHLRKLRAAGSPAGAAAVRRQAFGRISSVVKRAGEHLAFLRGASEKLSSLPAVFTDMPTIVIAGYPNVGKTTLLRALTGSAPEIAPYPFTTKGLQLGYFEHHHRRYQVIDTPGLFDRPLEKRNPIERQAIVALRHLADIVVFVLEPSETCGYEFPDQLRLLDDIRRTFAELEVLVAANKADLLDEDKMRRAREGCADAFFVVATTGQGVDELLKKVLEILAPDEA